MRSSSARRSSSASASMRVCVGSPGTFSTLKWRSAGPAVCGRGGVRGAPPRPPRAGGAKLLGDAAPALLRGGDGALGGLQRVDSLVEAVKLGASGCGRGQQLV